MKGSAFVHFLVVEMFPVWVIVSSNHRLITQVGTIINLHKQSAVHLLALCEKGNNDAEHACTVQDIVNHVKNGVRENMWFFFPAEGDVLDDISHSDSRQIQTYVDVYNNHTSSNGFAYSSMVAPTTTYANLFCGFCLAVGSLFMLVCSGVTNFKSGAYLAFTWDLERSFIYRAYVWYSAIAFAATCAFVLLMNLPGFVEWYCRFWGSNDKLTLGYAAGYRAAAPDFVLPGCVSAWSLYKLLLVHTPGFAWSTPEFKQLTFKRSWKDLFLQQNDAFSNSLAHALVQQQGFDESLAPLCEGYGPSELFHRSGKAPTSRLFEEV